MVRKQSMAKVLCAGAATFSAPLFAHHVMGGEAPSTLLQGLLSGLAHPVIGADHFVFLVVAGILAGKLEIPMRFIAPAVFVLSALIGTVLHASGMQLSGSEVLIAVTVIAGGLFVVTRLHLDAVSVSVFFSGAGLFHGYAYAEAILGAEAAPLVAYLAGLLLIQYALMVAAMAGLAKLGNPRIAGFAGGFAVVCGVAFLSYGFV